MPTAFITGISGQDGSYLTELLLDKHYEVHGLVRRTSNTVRPRLEELVANPAIYNHRLFLHYGDLDDPTTIRRLLGRIEPDEVYHLAGQSHVGLSFEMAESTCQLTAIGTLRLLEIIRDLAKKPRLLHASSSEVFGRPRVSPQNEKTPFQPITPYGTAKTFATHMSRIYRDSYELFVCNAICYNHESPRRGESFVTRKITQGVARIKAGLQDKLLLGDLEARRDWGFAKDYVEAMWRMLQQPVPDDFVIATGETHSVREFLDKAFSFAGLHWQDYVESDPRYLRPNDANLLVGDAQKAREALRWNPSISFDELVQLMVEEDMSRLIGHSPAPSN